VQAKKIVRNFRNAGNYFGKKMLYLFVKIIPAKSYYEKITIIGLLNSEFLWRHRPRTSTSLRLKTKVRKRFITGSIPKKS
jgi:hypothetical protein